MVIGFFQGVLYHSSDHEERWEFPRPQLAWESLGHVGICGQKSQDMMISSYPRKNRGLEKMLYVSVSFCSATHAYNISMSYSQ